MNNQKTIEIQNEAGTKLITITIDVEKVFGVKDFARSISQMIKKTRRALLEAAVDNEITKLDEGGKGDAS